MKTIQNLILLIALAVGGYSGLAQPILVPTGSVIPTATGNSVWITKGEPFLAPGTVRAVGPGYKFNGTVVEFLSLGYSDIEWMWSGGLLYFRPAQSGIAFKDGIYLCPVPGDRRALEITTTLGTSTVALSGGVSAPLNYTLLSNAVSGFAQGFVSLPGATGQVRFRLITY